MARIIDSKVYEVEAGTVECSGIKTGDIWLDGIAHAVEFPCNVWDWFESAEGYVNWWNVVSWECPECGTLNEFEIGD